ncbi:hypothetical protein [Kitasatospora sp. CB02891]|nr:hypothetical protein [Kitasatospora sp. CB02891]
MPSRTELAQLVGARRRGRHGIHPRTRRQIGDCLADAHPHLG